MRIFLLTFESIHECLLLQYLCQYCLSELVVFFECLLFICCIKCVVLSAARISNHVIGPNFRSRDRIGTLFVLVCPPVIDMRKYRYSSGLNLCVLEQIFKRHFGAISTALLPIRCQCLEMYVKMKCSEVPQNFNKGTKGNLTDMHTTICCQSQKARHLNV